MKYFEASLNSRGGKKKQSALLKFPVAALLPFKDASAELGIGEAVFDRLKNDIGTANIDEKLKPTLSYVKKLTLIRHQITQADASASAPKNKAIIDFLS
ncbi:hypothetical protein METHB2_100026 [Candidatus Methylobacter favarea]|uniref:Uncharacterized protein n=1 Tax=Candidatus Methylobacter favarea TaxID=2707345 RepID=A0A8S0X6N7_9GAMM|nr:hypothetical protein [Candidatus Methylobacter favarea]CAA9889385.1 hypothetical protein METHB2_100026 [Candidatus Methylobacter favarea]